MTEQHPDLTSLPLDRGQLLDPTTRAVAGLALAVVGLMGQNLVQAGMQVLLVGGSGGGGPARYFVASAVGAVLVPLAGLLLAWGPARAASSGWPTHVARAAVVVAVLAIAGAVLMALGGVFTDLRGGGLLPL